MLDPAQNDSFTDHYLVVPFDLSEVLFIATANFLQNIPGPLLDRMEIVNFAGYTEHEKLQIAKSYLVPRQLEENGLRDGQLELTDGAIREVISSYTRESGVRQLERELGRLARKVARRIAAKEIERTVARRGRRASAARPAARPSREDGARGPGRHRDRHVLHAGRRRHHVRRGLAHARQGRADPHGPARRRHEGVGARGVDVRAVARADWLGIDEKDFERDIHIHVPAGAIPKDGPSAGIAMASAVVSALSRRPVRHDVAMTGEITLSGRVLPIGGLKEKILGAVRAGITDFVIPRDNEADLEDLPEEVRNEIEVHGVSTLAEALAVTLRDARLANGRLQYGGERARGDGHHAVRQIQRQETKTAGRKACRFHFRRGSRAR